MGQWGLKLIYNPQRRIQEILFGRGPSEQACSPESESKCEGEELGLLIKSIEDNLNDCESD